MRPEPSESGSTEVGEPAEQQAEERVGEEEVPEPTEPTEPSEPIPPADVEPPSPSAPPDPVAPPDLESTATDDTIVSETLPPEAEDDMPDVDVSVDEEEIVEPPPAEDGPVSAPRGVSSLVIEHPDPVFDQNLPSLPEPGEPQEAGFGATPEEAARWEEVINEYEREAKAIGNEASAATLYLEMGRIWEEQLAKPRNAAMAYQRAFNLNPHDPAILHASRRLFTVVNNWAMVCQILGYEIEGAETPERKATLFAEKGAIFEEKMRNPEEAQRAYRDALDAWPAEPLAINALERLHLFRREYDQLYSVYERALHSAQTPERRVPLLVAAAQLAEDRLEDVETAITHYNEILSLDVKNALSLAALRRLTLQAAKWDQFINILTLSAEAADQPEEAAQHLQSASRVQHEKQGQTDRALLLLLKALEFAPEELTILRDIELLYEQNGRYDEVVKVLRRAAEVTTEPRDRVPMLFKLGSVLEEHLGMPEEAIPAFEEAVGLMPSYVPARQALGRLYGKSGKWQQLSELFQMEIRLEEDPGVKVSKLYKMAEIQEVKLEQEEEALKTLRELLTIKSDYQPARKYIEQLLQAREAWADLIALYEQELEITEDRDQKIFLLNRIGMLAEDKLSAVDHAWRAFETILDLSPGHLHAIRTMSRLATKREAWQDVLRMYELEVEATEDQKEVVSILHRAGVVTEEKLGDVEAAAVQYEKVLTLNPTYLPALRSLGRLFQQQERWDDMLQMFQRELDVSKSTDQTVALLFRIADIYVENLKDDDHAVDTYQKVLDYDRESLPALRALADIHARRDESEKLVEVLMREAETLKDPKERSVTLMRVAEICEDKLDRADRAAEAYQEVLRLGHSFDPAIRALVRIYSAEGMWNALSRALKTAFNHATEDSVKAAILVRCAEVAGDKLGNLDSAAEYLERALELQENDVTILSQLERISVARRDWKRAISVAEMLAQFEADPRLYAARQIRIAAMKETQLEPPESGAEHHRHALAKMPDHPVALRALEIAYRRACNWEGLAAFYQREAIVTKDEAKRVGQYFRAADVAEHRLQNLEFAAQMYDDVLKITSNHLPALKGRRRVAERQEDNAKVLECIRREGEVTADADRGRELLFQAGQLYQDQFKDLKQATETYESVLERSPDHVGAFSRLEAIYGETEAWKEQIDLLLRRANAIEDVTEQARLFMQAGTAAQDQLGDIETSIEHYREVLQRDKMHGGALVRLGPLLFERQDWDGAIDVLHRTLAVSKEPDVLLNSFRSLGVIYQEHRQDLVKCVQSFQAALQTEPGNLDCLRRLTAVYREAQDWGSAINVLLRLAEVEPEKEAKVSTLLDLADIYRVGASDPNNAILANQKVLEIESGNQTAILRLSELYEEKEDWQKLADVTAVFVQQLPPDQKERAAPLHLKMAAVFESKIKDDSRAINALKYALEAQPENHEALERLARLYAKSAETFPQAVDVHRRLLRIDPFRVASYHEMHQMFERRGEHDKAFVIAEILVYLRAQGQDEELYYREHEAKVASYTDAALPPRDHETLITHPGERNAIRAVLGTLGSELAKVFTSDYQAKFALTRKHRHGPKSPQRMRKLTDELAPVLGIAVNEYDIWIPEKTGTGLEVSLHNDKPAALVLGNDLPRRIQDKDQRFLIARELERLKGGHHLLEHQQLQGKGMEVLLWTLAKGANPTGSIPIDPAAYEAMNARLSKGLPSRARTVVKEAASALFSMHVDVTKHRAAAVHTANRAGFVVTNNIEVAVRNIAKRHPQVRAVFVDAKGAAETIGQIPEVRELLAYAISEEYFRVRARLGFSIQAT